jgi:hypothetical protein
MQFLIKDHILTTWLAPILLCLVMRVQKYYSWKVQLESIQMQPHEQMMYLIGKLNLYTFEEVEKCNMHTQ